LDNSLDIKKIMEDIRNKIKEKNEPEQISSENIIEIASKQYKKQRESILKSDSKASEELKYLESLNLNSSELKTLKSDNDSFESELEEINSSYDIQTVNPIDTSKPKIIRNLVLKIRHILQNEIRFTLNPIIQNQIKFNAHTVRILNELSKLIEFNHQLQEQTKQLQEQTKQLQEQTKQLQEQTKQQQEQTKQQEEQTKQQEEQTKQLQEQTLTTHIDFLCSNYLKRNPSKKEIDFWLSSSKNKIQFNEIERLIKDSAEAKQVQKKFLKSLGIKKDINGFYKIFDDHKIYLDINDQILVDSYAQSNFHEFGTVQAVKKLLKPKMNIINIGANIGYYTLLAAKKVGLKGKVFAFEPGKEALKYLELNIQTNNYSNIEIIPKAVSNFSGNANLFLHDSITGHSLYSDQENSKKLEISTITIDEFLKEKNIRVYLAIIDAEGSEQLILEGMKETIQKNPELEIVLEFNPHSLELAGTNDKSFIEFIKKLGFSIYVIDEFEETVMPKSPNEVLQVAKTEGHFNLFLTKKRKTIFS